MGCIYLKTGVYNLTKHVLVGIYTWTNEGFLCAHHEDNVIFVVPSIFIDNLETELEWKDYFLAY